MVAASDSTWAMQLSGLFGVPQLPGGAFYAFPNVKATGRKSRDLARDLLEQEQVGSAAVEALELDAPEVGVGG